MPFRAAASRGGWVGLALLALLGALALGVAWGARASWPGPRAAVLLLVLLALVPLLGVLAYWTWGFFSLRYHSGRDGIVIRWAASRQVIPMESITHVLAGRGYAAPLKGLRWPGHWVGRTIVVDDDEHPRPTLVYATVPPPGQLLIVTPALAYAISPADRVAFIEDFKVRRRLGPVQALEQGTEQAGLIGLGLWRDPAALRLLAAGCLLGALLLAWITWQFPSLPQELFLQLRYDPLLSSAVPGPPQAPSAVWRLPMIGLLALAANTVLAALVHGRARVGALLLILGALLVQLVLMLVFARVA